MEAWPSQSGYRISGLHGVQHLFSITCLCDVSHVLPALSITRPTVVRAAPLQIEQHPP